MDHDIFNVGQAGTGAGVGTGSGVGVGLGARAGAGVGIWRAVGLAPFQRPRA